MTAIPARAMALVLAFLATPAGADDPLPLPRPDTERRSPHRADISLAAVIAQSSDPASTLDLLVRRAIVDDDPDLFRATLIAAGYRGLSDADDDAQRLMMGRWLDDTAANLPLRIAALAALEAGPAPRAAWVELVERSIARGTRDIATIADLVAGTLADGHPDLADLVIAALAPQADRRRAVLDTLTRDGVPDAAPCLDMRAFLAARLPAASQRTRGDHVIAARLGLDVPAGGLAAPQDRLEAAIGAHRANRPSPPLLPPGAAPATPTDRRRP